MGRDDVLLEITRMLDAAASGRGQAVQLSGEPGLGRSAVLAECAALAAERGFGVAVIEAAPADAGLAWSGVLRLLHVGSTNPEVRTLLDAIEADAIATEASERGSQPPGRDLAVQVLQTLRSLATVKPLLIGIDDVHRLDARSRDVLAFVAHRLLGTRVVVMTTCVEPGEVMLGVPVVRLTPLDRADSLDLIDPLVPGQALAGALIDVGQGNPAALVDLAGSLTADQLAGLAPPPTTLPRHSRLRQVAREQLDRLPPATRLLLLLVAADEQLDAATSTGAVGHSDIGTLVQAARLAQVDLADLEPAEVAGLLEVTSHTVRFPHAWMRSVVYHEASLARRQHAHAVLARALANSPDPLRRLLHAAASREPSDGLAAELETAAWAADVPHSQACLALDHAARLSTDPRDAAYRRLAAAERAWLSGDAVKARRLASQRAEATPETDQTWLSPVMIDRADLLRAELSLTTDPPDVAFHRLMDAALRVFPTDSDRALDALVRAGDLLLRHGGDHRFAAIAAQVLAMSDRLTTPSARLLIRQFEGMTALIEGRYTDAVKPLEELFSLARGLDTPVALVRAASCAILLGDDRTAHELAERALAVGGARGEGFVAPRAVECLVRANLELGRLAHAEAWLAEGVRQAVLRGRQDARAHALAWLAMVAAMRGDLSACADHVAQARVRAGRGEGAAQVHAVADWAMAYGDLAAGRPAQTVERLRTVGRLNGPGGRTVMQVMTATQLVEAAVKIGDHDTARAAFRTFEPWAQHTGRPHWLALTARCRALLTEDDDEADRWFAEADRWHRAAGGSFHAARTALLYGQRLRRRRRSGEARLLVTSALEVFERYPAPAWADQARSELRAGQAPSEDRADPLTPQQREVAALVVSGATNREIAQALQLSTRTVEYHLRNIFARLGVRSRMELARRLE